MPEGKQVLILVLIRIKRRNEIILLSSFQSIASGFRFYCMDWLCGSLVCLDAHFHRPGWSGENLGLPTGQGTRTALRTRKGGRGGEGREKGGGEEVEIFNN